MGGGEGLALLLTGKGKEMKKIAQEYRLVDEQGVEWVRAALTDSKIKTLIRRYKELNIWLTPERIAA